MRISSERVFAAKLFGTGELARGIRMAVQEYYAQSDCEPEVSYSERLPDGARARHEKVSASSLELVCDLTSISQIEWVGQDADERFSFFNISAYQDRVLISAAADTADDKDRLLHLLAEHLRLSDYSPPARNPERETDPLQDLSRRVETLEKRISGHQRLACFLSYRFGPTNEPVASLLRRFLSLLGVDVIAGVTYEPRRVSEKVSERLNQSIDFVVLLVTADGESFWTRDEIATATAKGVPIIPLVQEGAELTGGILGDLEYIRFPANHVSETFIPILEGINYIRATKGTSDPS